VIEVVHSYLQDLKRSSLYVGPLRNSEEPNLSHLGWMCGQILQFVEQDKMDKAMRWLGFVQGAFWVFRFRTVEAMKQDNKPEGEAFERDRV